MNILTQFEDRGEDGIVEVAVELPFSLGTPSIPTRTADPVLTFEDGVLELTPGTFSAALSPTYVWYRDSVEMSPQPVGMTYEAQPEDNLKSFFVTESITGLALLNTQTNTILVEVEEVGEIPAKITPSLVTIYEITDPEDPDAGSTGRRRRLTLGNITVPEGWELRWTSPVIDGGVPPGTLVLPNASSTRNNSLALGVENFNIIYWYRQVDGAVFNALPPSGVTANGKAITPVTGFPDDGQIILVMEGFEDEEPPVLTDWPALGQAAIDDAMSADLARFIATNTSGSNTQRTRNAYLALVYESRRGNTSTDARVLAQLDYFLSPNRMPHGMSGPSAIREAPVITFFLGIKQTPRLWDSLTTTQKNQMEAIVKALLVVNAFIVADDNPRPGGNDMSNTGALYKVRSVGPNIAFGPLANIVNACSYLSPNVALGYLKTFSYATLRSEVLSLFGSSSQLYIYLNWRNGGWSADNPYMRAGASSEAPTDTTIENALRNFRYYGVSLPDLTPLLLFPNEERGLNQVLLPTARDYGANVDIGRVVYAVRGNAGVTINGTVYGTCINNKLSTPYLGEEGCMVYELNGRDDGGARGSMSYASWTMAGVDQTLLCVAWAESMDFADPKLADWLIRWQKAHEIFDHFDTNDYRSCSHNTSTSTKAGGPGGNVLWSLDKADSGKPPYCTVAHKALWDAIATKLSL